MHNHNHSRTDNIKRAIVLNVFFTIIELIGGILTNSLAVLSDAVHDLGDSATLLSAYFAEIGAERDPDTKRTFGYQRLSLISALVNALVLITGSLIILTHALPRLFNPQPVNSLGMIGLAVLGIVINGAGYLGLKGGESSNESVLSWHFMEDVLGWVAVLIGGTLIFFFDIPIIDPLLTVGYTMFILWGVYKNGKEILNIFLQGVPSHIDIDHIKEGLYSLDGIIDVHDVHVWSLEGETDVFTGHVAVDKKSLQNRPQTINRIKKELGNHHIEHSTIELEDKKHCSNKKPKHDTAEHSQTSDDTLT